MTEEIMKNIKATHEKVISILADYISGGYIDTLAKLLIYMDAQKAEETLCKLPEPVQAQVRESYKKNSDKKITDPEIIESAKTILKQADYWADTLCDTLKEGLNYQQKEELSKSSQEVVNQDPIIALHIENCIYTFDTILNLDDRDVQKVLQEVDEEDIKMAMKSASLEVQDKLFKNMSKRIADKLKNEIELMGTIPQKDIDNAKEKIIKIIHNLDDNGEIIIYADPEDVDEELSEEAAQDRLRQPRHSQELRQYIND